jgi:hypothetical protein
MRRDPERTVQGLLIGFAATATALLRKGRTEATASHNESMARVTGVTVHCAAVASASEEL